MYFKILNVSTKDTMILLFQVEYYTTNVTLEYYTTNVTLVMGLINWKASGVCEKGGTLVKI